MSTAKKKVDDPTTVVHKKQDDGDFIGIGNLRVLVTNADGSWFAQGLEIDYAAEGTSIEDVQRRFEQGLKQTISEHLKLFSNIQKLIAPAPADIWRQLAADDGCLGFHHSQASFHPLRFQGIQYYEIKAA
jgi:hypothetical protein